MCKEELRHILIENGICYVKVVRTPDWRGGYKPIVYFNDEARDYTLEDFEYVEFEGDTDKASDNYEKVFEEVYNRGKETVEHQSLEQLVWERIHEYE